jgi:multiple sugar transport system substrate-binding protein
MSAMHYYSNVSRCFGDPDSIDSWMMDGDGTTINFNTPLHEEIANWYLELMDSRVAPRAADRIDTGLFVNGFTATHASTVGNVTNFLTQIDDRFEMAAALLPVGPEGRQGTCYSGNQHMINANTPHPEEAWELMKLFAGGEAGVIMVLEGRLQPNGARSAWTNPEVNEINHMYGVTDSLLTAGIEPFPMPRNTRFTEANNIFQNELEAVWEGDEPWGPQAALIEERVQQVLDMDRPD